MLKNSKILFGLLFAGVIFVISQTSSVSAMSIKELLGLEKTKTEAKQIDSNQKKSPKSKKESADWAKISGQESGLNSQVDWGHVSLLMTNMDEQERLKILEDPALFKRVIESEANNKAIVSAAMANELVQDRNVEFLMRRGAEDILREVYLSRLVVSKLPEDFPSNEQLSEYFNANKEQFVMSERLHVWQIFFKKSEKADKKESVALKKKVDKIISDIKSGKADYSNIAISQSEHEQSKAIGGYMGLLETSDLLPEIRKVILKLKVGEISKPVESKTGIHILKRSEILKKETLELSQIEPQVRQLLVNQSNSQLRDAIFVRARKEYPQNIPDKDLEEWRLKLRATHIKK